MQGSAQVARRIRYVYHAATTTETITCPTHGESQFAYVCKHLIANPAQKWHCGCPEEDDPWRDAWCSVCNEAYEREGEWNENNEGIAEIGMLCGHCYENGIAQSVTSMMTPLLPLGHNTWRPNAMPCSRSRNRWSTA